jgi:uncharacterized protein (DUF305 family)
MRTRTMTVVGVLAAALLLSACGDDSPSTGAAGDSPSSPTTTASQATFSQQDRDFAAGMRAHHAQAVDMAEMVLASSPTPDVATLAERIRTAQSPEIAELDAILAEMGEVPAGSSGHGSTHDADMPMHAGMMTDEQMQMLDGADGADGVEACRQFLTLMQEHHDGAIASADKQLADGSHPPLLKMARDIRDSQAAEITEMQQLLSQL